MTKIVSSTFVSLDGVVNHMDRWHFDYIDDESGAIALDQLTATGALLMGRKTYESYAAAWPGRPGEYADRINGMPKYVVSSSLQDPSWANTSVIRSDLGVAAARLKDATNGDILMHGYGPVAQELLRLGLLDELHLWVHPKLAGIGTADDTILTQGLGSRFELLGVRALQSGVVLLSYGASSAPGNA